MSQYGRNRKTLRRIMGEKANVSEIQRDGVCVFVSLSVYLSERERERGRKRVRERNIMNEKEIRKHRERQRSAQKC